MSALPHESRPGGETEAAETFRGVVTSVVPEEHAVRCTRCGHLLTAVRSLALELGPVCRRVVA